MGSVDFQFVPPPEAPVFEPSEEEFQDPLAYIAKIRPVAEKSGICKIKPPPDWQPPFAVDVDNFKFTPRIQRLNELEAKTRIKLNFLDQIAKFWELQGSTLRIPNVERKALDLFTLHKLVQDEGGYDTVTRERKWSRISSRMGYPLGRSVGSLLRGHYERILYPYDLFLAGTNIGELKIKEEKEEFDKDKDYVPHSIPSRQAIKPPAERYSRRSKRVGKDPGDCVESNGVPAKSPAKSDSGESVDYATNNELRKLQFYGAGPKMPGFSSKGKAENDFIESKPKGGKGGRGKAKPIDPIDQIVCHTCGRGDAEESMLLCDGCDDSYHTFCLIPPLTEIPKGDWRCPLCIAVECRKPQEAFGFEQATKEYTLQSFGEMADQFKSNYFNMPVHMVPHSTVEKEFWRLTCAIDEDVTVEYGADLHTMDHGSGFPTKNSKNLMPGDEEYANSGWNLNNLPVAEGSVLSHINADISGMKIPWMYVGMCFATFCWHNEDHWSYSINYLHWGEPKTWYGVPGERADCFENSMKSAAPELFESQPDLLHQLVTIMNPNILMNAGVPVFRTNQNAGEFVVTFPRAYHAGFNQGYNFAEAVNFCPADWLSIGRNCIDQYSRLQRFCVFSHDELVCKMAADPDSLDLNLAASTYQDMLRMVEKEKELRKILLNRGVTEAEREAFELLPDDERQCDYCKTTCFLSAVTCSCSSNQLVCIKHVDYLCKCPPSKHCLRYRYTLDELPVMLHRLKVRAESFDNWAAKVKNALEATHGSKLELLEMKELIAEAEERKFPESELLGKLVTAVQDAEKCASIAQQLVSKKVRTRNRQQGDAKYVARLTLKELQLFYEEVNGLSCEIKEAALVKDLLDQVTDFQQEAKEVLEEEMPDIKKLEKLIDFGVTLDIDLPEVPNLKQKLQQVCWLEEVQTTLLEPNQVTVDVLRKLLDHGVNLPPHSTVEKAMAELQELLTQVERWEEKARICLQARPRHVMATLEAIINEAKNIPAFLPNTMALKDALKRAKEWTAKVEIVQNGEHYPYLDMLENLVNKGRPIPVRLDQLPQVESQVAAAKSWRERTARTFLKKNSTYSLSEVLSPRTDIGIYPNNKNKKKKLKELNPEKEKDKENYLSLDIKFEEARDPATIVAAFKQSEHQEIEAMRQLRIKNLQKRAEDMGDAKYCVCRKGLSGFMLQCELCKDWFHATCVPLPKSAALKNKTGTTLVSQMAKDLKFLCPLCLRSRRPRLETILSLLVSLQKLPVRLPEGEALQCLTERAMSWQDRARQALATDELAAALAKLSVLSQRMVEQAAREKTEKIINAELLKAASNPELQPHLQSMAQSAFGGLHSEQVLQAEDSLLSSDDHSIAEPPTEPAIVMDVETSSEVQPLHGPLSPAASHSSDALAEGDLQQNYNSSEHAYSSASKPNQGQTPRKHARKSPLVPRQLETPVLELSELAKAQLEELMMEGDLLEVSLDETQHIWRILQATKPRREDKFPDFEDLENDYLADKDKDKKRKIKKRKLEDVEGTKKLKLKEKMKIKKEDSKDIDIKPKKKLKIDQDGKVIKKVLKCKEGNTKDIPEIKKEGKERERLKMKPKPKRRPMKIKDGEALSSKPGEKADKAVKSEAEGETDSDDDEDDVEEDCAAGKCLKPTGQEVNWVQCDGGCDQWFHWVCVGLKKGDLSENEDYVCTSCRKRKPGGFRVRSADGVKGQKKEKPQGRRMRRPPRRTPSIKEEVEVKEEIELDDLVKPEDSSFVIETTEECISEDMLMDEAVQTIQIDADMNLASSSEMQTLPEDSLIAASQDSSLVCDNGRNVQMNSSVS